MCLRLKSSLAQYFSLTCVSKQQAFLLVEHFSVWTSDLKVLHFSTSLMIQLIIFCFLTRLTSLCLFHLVVMPNLSPDLLLSLHKNLRSISNDLLLSTHFPVEFQVLLFKCSFHKVSSDSHSTSCQPLQIFKFALQTCFKELCSSQFALLEYKQF